MKQDAASRAATANHMTRANEVTFWLEWWLLWLSAILLELQAHKIPRSKTVSSSGTSPTQLQVAENLGEWVLSVQSDQLLGGQIQITTMP